MLKCKHCNGEIEWDGYDWMHVSNWKYCKNHLRGHLGALDQDETCAEPLTKTEQIKKFIENLELSK